VLRTIGDRPPWLGQSHQCPDRAAKLCFFATVDQARETFRDAALRGPDALTHALLGVKVINLLIAKHEYCQGAVSTTARPIGFMLDPANQCHLGCPSCSNSYNTEVVARTYNPWPRGMMTDVTFEAFLREVGLYAFAGHFYNNHEPLLNKLTPAFVRKATDLRLRTFISSNLSYRGIDAEAIVASGLTELMVAADGATQPVYERYRRGGRIEWVLDNARAISAAKHKLGSSTPILRWQYLTFAHNLPEIPAAIELARDIGFDTFNLATPNERQRDEAIAQHICSANMLTG
jgi:MoaA/NifB/PqqE/SkfB family radical SAM enzyme